MSELYLLFGASLLMATVVVTILCAGTGRSKLHRRKRTLAKICRGLGIAVAGGGTLFVIFSVILSVSAAEAPGLTQSDRTRIWSNCIAEAGYNVILTLVVAVPALLVARRSLRER